MVVALLRRNANPRTTRITQPFRHMWFDRYALSG